MKALTIALFLMFSHGAIAHPLPTYQGGSSSGLAHLLFGLDHWLVLAALALVLHLAGIVWNRLRVFYKNRRTLSRLSLHRSALVIGGMVALSWALTA